MALIEFQGEMSFDEPNLDLSILEISLKHGIRHMNVCGGHARCSTCRVMVMENLENCTPPTVAEQKLGIRKGFESNIRLACQTRVTGPVKLRRLAIDEDDVSVVVTGTTATTGREANLAILFSDIRDFTTFSEKQLPYDVIHILNRYFQCMGDCILRNHGYIDKYIGDGIMAIFGIEGNDPQQACRDAVSAALRMQRELVKLNRYLKKFFDADFRVGIGIHSGVAVLGSLGHPERRQLTVIGDTVNMASRVESSTKQFGVPILVSEVVRQHLAGRVRVGRSFEAHLKGKSGSYTLHEVLGIDDVMSPGNTFIMRRDLRDAMLDTVTRSTAPQFLKLAFHDAGTYSIEDGLGGANGSIRFPEELAREENKGLDVPMGGIARIKQSFPETSWADLIATAGAIAVLRTGGPEMDLPLGREDATVPSPGRLEKLRHLGVEGLVRQFSLMGLTKQELVVLSGAHTIGRNVNMPFTDDWFEFTNSYFRIVSGPDAAKRHMLPTDIALLHDPECREWVGRYALDNTLFRKHFASAYVKMTLLGTKIPVPDEAPKEPCDNAAQ